MEQLSRTELYGWVLNSENNIFLESIENSRIREILFEYREIFFTTLRFNLQILRDIEINYISTTQDKDEKRVAWTNEEFRARFEENLEEVSEHYGNDREKTYRIFADEITNSPNSYYAFNKLIKQLDKTSNEWLGDLYKYIEAKGNNYYVNDLSRENQVFLSYAYEDRLYTLCLYIFMYSKGINLYVDWLFCNGLSSGVYIKENLYKELMHSEQFLFLRTINSELQIKGNKSIRGWCSWEMGVFYERGFSEKYYLELYSRPDRKVGTVGSLQLDGLRKLTNIHTRRLHSI